MNDGAGASAIRIEGLHKDFGDYPVLRDLEFSGGWGRLVVVFGANGSGKTTLLRLLSTQYRPDRGEIWVAGIPRSRDPVAIRRVIGVVAHQPMLYQDMTCQENLLFFGRMYRIPEPQQRIEEVLGQLGIQSLRHRRTGTLSHGMQKRIAIARALLHDPPILLMDEPESGLDQDSLERVRTMLVDRVRQGRTVLMTTHNVDVGMALADEVAVLSDGAISYQGDRDVLDESRFRFTHLSRMEIVT